MNRKLMSLCAAMILVVASILPIVMVPVYTEPIEVYVVIGDVAGNSNYILSHGDGTFSSQEYIGRVPEPLGYWRGCGIGDFDNDGRFDYVIGTGDMLEAPPSLECPIYLYEKLGPGNNFAPPVSVGTWTEGMWPTDFAVADYNKDGKMDFVLTHYGKNWLGVIQNSELYLGDGDFTFTRSVLTNTLPLTSVGADSADINNDGNPDFAVAQFNGTIPYYIYVNLGHGNGTFTTTSFEASSGAFGLTAADFDNDTKVDIVSGGVLAAGWYFYKGNGNGTFQSGVLLSGVKSNHSPIDNYDFNNDGNQDIIIGYGTSALYYSGNGDGTFKYGTEITGGSGYWRCAISAPPTEMVPIVPGPRARFTWEPTRQLVNEPVAFNASTSKPVEMPIVRYAWDFDSDGVIDDYGVTVTHIFSAAGSYTVTLNVTDSHGFWDTKTHTIKVVSVGTAINDGVSWLADRQNPDGSWGSSYPVAQTGLAVLKLEEHAVDWKHGYGLPSPFDPRYPYCEKVEKGLNYIFAHAYLIDIAMQPAGDPDTNANGKGVYFMSFAWSKQQRTYETSIAMMAIAGSRAPNKVVNVPESPVDGWTYKDVLQDSADYLAFGQNDADWERGGWGYFENTVGRSDQSCGGWAVFGLGFAESPAYKFMCTIPAFVKTELNIWIDYIQNDVDGDTNHGGAGYFDPNGGANILRTGHLLYMMAFVGDTAVTPRVQDAVAYLVRHWNDPDYDPGWKGYPEYPYWGASYQATLNVMKGLFTLGIHQIDGIDWQNEFEHVLVAQQLDDGSWPYTIWGDGDRILGTEWALLTLEKVAPPPIRYVDIKPGSWPNPINLASRGVLPVAICGTADFDVRTINVTTIKLSRQGVSVGVSPIRWAYEDVATPWTGEPGGGHALGGDGYLDLTLKFSTQEVTTTLGLDAFLKQKIPLIITGNLNQAAGGTHFTGQDYVWILNLPGDANDDLVVNIIDVSMVSAHWYPGPPIGPLGYGAASDLNGDGNVDILDIALISSQWAHFWQP